MWGAQLATTPAPGGARHGRDERRRMGTAPVRPAWDRQRWKWTVAGAPETLVVHVPGGRGAGGRCRCSAFSLPKTKVDLQVLTQDYPKQFALAPPARWATCTPILHWVFYDAINKRVIRPID
jgi:hypothetical protein